MHLLQDQTHPLFLAFFSYLYPTCNGLQYIAIIGYTDSGVAVGVGLDGSWGAGPPPPRRLFCPFRLTVFLAGALDLRGSFLLAFLDFAMNSMEIYIIKGCTKLYYILQPRLSEW
jgi:hypothetical protein